MSFYRALLRLYPSSFRGEYGRELTEVFERTHVGRSPVTRGLAAISDVVPNAASAHWEILRQDLRFSARGLRRAPGFALTAVLIVALGVGANTAAFSLADFVLIRSLPFPDADRLVKMNGGDDVSPAVARDWKAMTKAFSSVSTYNFLSANLTGTNEPQRVDGARVAFDLMSVLGAAPLIGRGFTDADDRPGAAPTVVLSYGLWQAQFGGETSIIGRTVELDGSTHTVVGVMPSRFNFPHRGIQFWKPFQFPAENFEDRDDSWIHVIGRMRDGVTLAQARADIASVVARLEETYPREKQRSGADAYLLQDDLSRQAKLLLQTLVGAAFCILLLSCANLANLLLARAAGREREMAVRTALGAGKERLVRQMVTESTLLALIGGIAGVFVAIAAVPPLARLVPSSLPLAAEPGVDLRVLAFAAILTLVTGLAFGMLPAIRAGRVAPVDGMRDGSRGGGRRQRARFLLVTVEVMASVVLLISSGLLVRALLRVQSTDPGFRAEGVLTMRTQLPMPRYATVARRAEFYGKVLAEVRALPGVTSAAYVTGLPMSMRGGIWPVIQEGLEEPKEGWRSASSRFTTPQFFATLGIPIQRGRDIGEEDRADQPFVAVVSEELVRQHWPGEDGLGKRFQFGGAVRTVVGVVGDIRVRGLEQRSEPQVYMAYQQVDDSAIINYVPKDLVIQSSSPTGALLPAVRRILRAADPQQPVSAIRPLSEIVADETASRLAQLRVLGALAAIAILLAAVGIHGLLSFMVSQRAQEFGVRLALGARPRRIVRMVLREGVLLTLAGVIPGVAIAYAAGRAMQSLLFGVEPADPATLITAVVLCSIMAIVGSLLPALRAVRVDPARVMRAE
jgi:predicted permease